MIKHGIKGVVPGGKRVDEVATEWQAALAASGRETELGEDLELVLQVILADTEERAISAASVWFEEQLMVLAPLGRNAVSDPGADLGYLRSGTGTGHRAPGAGLPTVRDLVRDGAWICGPREHVFERICEYQERLPGLTRVSVGAGALAIPPSALREHIGWFGSEVLPSSWGWPPPLPASATEQGQGAPMRPSASRMRR